MDRARTHTTLLTWAVTSALVLTGCIATGEVVTPDPTSPSASTSATPIEAAAPVVGLAVLADDPAALVMATLRARDEGGELRVVAGVPSPADRDAWRSLDALTVLASDERSGARLGRSAGQTVAVTEVLVGNLAEELAAHATGALAAGPDFTGTVHVALTTEAATLVDEVTALAPGDLLLAADGDVRAAGPANAALRAALEAGVDVALLSDEADAAWQLDVVRGGLEVPGGGQLLRGRRYIAGYGTPGTPSLGVLGEQGVEAAHQRILRIAEPYDDGTMQIVPVFEIIAAVASASATADGDYSYGISFDYIREWVDYAAANDILVILDIQPGRTDFLTHAKQYEEFLVQPHVGLALDPEWRLKPNQVHLRQIGTVDGAEINQVIDWLAALVREHALPQKMLIMHQFKLSMITNRELVRSPDELFVVLHMDGQGGQPAKGGTYRTLIDADQPWAPGWKNFYDEDHPMASADRVLAVEPQPVFISFQ